MSFGAYASDFDGTDEQARDAYADHMADVRSGRADLEVSLDSRDSTPEPPAILDPDSVHRNRRRAELYRATGIHTWPTTNPAEKAKE